MHRLLVVLVLVAACDAGTFGAEQCKALEDELRAAIATHGTCGSEADCTRVAGAELDACDGEAYMISCGGVPVEINAPGRARAEQLTREFFDKHCDEGRTGAFDCAPDILHCNADHHCTSTSDSCLPPPR